MDGLLLALRVFRVDVSGIRVTGRLTTAKTLAGSFMHVAHHGDSGAGGTGSAHGAGGRTHGGAGEGGDRSKGEHFGKEAFDEAETGR